jgi:ribose 5-phosphate isomerase A
MAILPASDAQAQKRAAAARALELVEDGMKLGLGTGTTAEFFLELLAERVKAGLCVVGTPTSERTGVRARALGIPIDTLDALGTLDLAVDGADEADRALNLIKGGGGALLREKIVAASATRLAIIADESKLVARLGAFALPVEVLLFGHGTTARRIADVAARLGYPGLAPKLRLKDGAAFRTDSGNGIYDCPFGAIADAPRLADALSAVPGVVDHGLFIGMASVLFIAGSRSVEEIRAAGGK